MARGGFPGMGGGNMQQLARQAQKLQQQMAKMEEELEAREYEAASGGGMVTAKVSGKKELIALPYGMCRYGRRRMELMTAAEMYALDVMKTVKSSKNHIKEIDFAQQVRGDPADV